jgi:hypothetical protein
VAEPKAGRTAFILIGLISGDEGTESRSSSEVKQSYSSSSVVGYVLKIPSGGID